MVIPSQTREQNRTCIRVKWLRASGDAATQRSVTANSTVRGMIRTWYTRGDLDGALLRPVRAILRYLLALLSLGSGIGLLWALIDPERQFLHDRLIGSRIVVTDGARQSLEGTDTG